MLRIVLFTCFGMAGLAGPAPAQMLAPPPEGLPIAALAQSASSTALVAAPPSPMVFLTADEMPVFAGGDAAQLKFLSKHLSYPGPALEHSISGKVHVTFTIDAEGRPRDPRVVKGLGYGLDEEAVRLVRLMPWWNPGHIKGQPVWVQVTMPIMFRAL